MISQGLYMGKAELNSAKQAIGTILRQLVVTQVVYVDDVFDDTQDVAKVIGWLGEAYSKSPAEASALILDSRSMDLIKSGLKNSEVDGTSWILLKEERYSLGFQLCAVASWQQTARLPAR